MSLTNGLKPAWGLAVRCYRAFERWIETWAANVVLGGIYVLMWSAVSYALAGWFGLGVGGSATALLALATPGAPERVDRALARVTNGYLIATTVVLTGWFGVALSDPERKPSGLLMLVAIAAVELLVAKNLRAKRTHDRHARMQAEQTSRERQELLDSVDKIVRTALHERDQDRALQGRPPAAARAPGDRDGPIGSALQAAERLLRWRR